MSRRNQPWRSVAAASLLVGLLGICSVALTTPVQASNGNPGVLPPNSHPYGKTYGEWSALWWKWALEIPAPSNPLLDETGAQIASGQSGNVWFLAGVLNVSGTAERTGTVPSGKALFFPVLNFEGDNYLCVDPDTTYSVQELRNLIRGAMDGASDLAADVDGAPIDVTASYRVTSPVFDINVPDDNIFQALGCGDPAGNYSPAVSDGYFLMLAPLSHGHHDVHFHGALPGFALDITYHLTVQ